MVKIERGFYDYFLWEQINQKYWMKYNTKYEQVEEDFINDLLKYKIIIVRFKDYYFKNYQEIVKHKETTAKDIRLLQKIGKNIYDKEIDDCSYLGETTEKIIW